MASLRLAGREGIGVDRMVRDLVALGRPEPEISEIAGPAVRVALLGGDPDPEIVGLLSGLEPRNSSRDLDVVLIIDHLTRHRFIDVELAQPVLQRPAGETSAALERALAATTAGQPVISPLQGVPDGRPPAYRLSDEARGHLPDHLGRLGSLEARNHTLLEWARHRERVSSTEAADLTGISIVRAGQVLTNLEEDGLLAPGRPVTAGRGFFYVPA